MLLDHDEPTNYEEAMMSPDSAKWFKAMKSFSDPTRMDQVSVLKCHPWIGMLTHTVLEDI